MKLQGLYPGQDGETYLQYQGRMMERVSGPKLNDGTDLLRATTQSTAVARALDVIVTMRFMAALAGTAEDPSSGAEVGQHIAELICPQMAEDLGTVPGGEARREALMQEVSERIVPEIVTTFVIDLAYKGET